MTSVIRSLTAARRGGRKLINTVYEYSACYQSTRTLPFGTFLVNIINVNINTASVSFVSRIIELINKSKGNKQEKREGEIKDSFQELVFERIQQPRLIRARISGGKRKQREEKESIKRNQGVEK